MFQKRAPRSGPDWIDVAGLKYASGTSAKEAVVARRRRPGVGSQPRLRRPQSASRDAPGTSTTPTSSGWTSTRCPVWTGRRSSPSHWWPERSSPTTGSLRGRRPRVRAASTSMPASIRAGRTSRYGWPPRPSPARSNCAPQSWRPASGGRKNAKASSSTSTRTPRIAPSRRPTRSVRGPTRECRRHFTGQRCPTAGPRRSRWRQCRARYAEIGDPWEGIDDAPGGLDALLDRAKELGPAEKAPKGSTRGTGRRESTMPLIEIARTKTKDEAMAALDTWRHRYPAAAERLEPVDVLVDGMRGPSSIWYPHPRQPSARA